jgi:hypothetical protein
VQPVDERNSPKGFKRLADRLIENHAVRIALKELGPLPDEFLFDAALFVGMLSRLREENINHLVQGVDKELLRAIDGKLTRTEESMRQQGHRSIRPLSVTTIYSMINGGKTTDRDVETKVVSVVRHVAELDALYETKRDKRRRKEIEEEHYSKQSGKVGWTIIVLGAKQPVETPRIRNGTKIDVYVQYLVNRKEGVETRMEVLVRKITFYMNNGKIIE